MHINLAASGIKQTTRTETLNQYFNDVRKKSMTSKEEAYKDYKAYKTESNPIRKNRLRDKIINENLLFVISIAKRYSTDNTLMDVIQEGNIGLIRALDSFDPDKEVSFITYAVNFIVREINDYKSKHDGLIRQNNSCKVYHIQARAKEALFKKYNREPSLDEIKEYINENYKRYHLKDANDLVNVKLTYVDEDIKKGTDEPSNTSDILEYNTYSASQNDCVRIEEQQHNSFITESLLKCLKPIEQDVVKYSFGIGHFREYKLSEIAEKLHYSEERIRQIREKALKKLKEGFNAKFST